MFTVMSRKKKRRLITDLKEKLEYYAKVPRRKDGTIRNIGDLCPYCSDKNKKIHVTVYWLVRDRGYRNKPRWIKSVKQCGECGRIFSKEKREVETF